MDAERMTERVGKAIEIAGRAWNEAHRGLPSSPMTKTAAIPATGVLAAALLGRPELDEAEAEARVAEAIEIARRAWQLTHRHSPGNPIAATAERSVIGIIAAGILSSPDSES